MRIYLVMTEWPENERVKKSLLWRFFRWIGRHHLFAIVDDGTNLGRYILVDPESNGLSITTLSLEQIGTYLRINPPLDVLVVDGYPGKQDFSWFEPVTCVTIVKRLIGLNAPCVLTPKQLFRRLKNG